MYVRCTCIMHGKSQKSRSQISSVLSSFGRYNLDLTSIDVWHKWVSLPIQLWNSLPIQRSRNLKWQLYWIFPNPFGLLLVSTHTLSYFRIASASTREFFEKLFDSALYKISISFNSRIVGRGNGWILLRTDITGSVANTCTSTSLFYHQFHNSVRKMWMYVCHTACRQ